MTKISVIIPTWNREKTLGKAILSALNQTFPPFEVIVCGVEGSPDQKVVNSINDSRVRWIEGGRDGLASIPRNRGIKASRGDWLAFLDSDDEWLPDKLEKQLKYANNMGYSAACSDAIRYIPSQGYKGTLLSENVLGNLISFPLLTRDNYVVCSSVLIEKDIVERCGGFPEDRSLKVGEDYALWLRAATFTNFAFVNEPLLIYRDEPKKSMRAFTPPIWELRVNVFNSFISWANSSKYNRVNNNRVNNKVNKKYLYLAKRLLLEARTRKVLSGLIENAKKRIG